MDSKSVCQLILLQLNELRLSSHLCDAVLYSSEPHSPEIPAHSLILAACSDILREQIKSTKNPSGKHAMCIHGVSTNEIVRLLDFFYTGQIQFQNQKEEKRFQNIGKALQSRMMENICKNVTSQEGDSIVHTPGHGLPVNIMSNSNDLSKSATTKRIHKVIISRKPHDLPKGSEDAKDTNVELGIKEQDRHTASVNLPKPDSLKRIINTKDVGTIPFMQVTNPSEQQLLQQKLFVNSTGHIENEQSYIPSAITSTPPNLNKAVLQKLNETSDNNRKRNKSGNSSHQSSKGKVYLLDKKIKSKKKEKTLLSNPQDSIDTAQSIKLAVYALNKKEIELRNNNDQIKKKGNTCFSNDHDSTITANQNSKLQLNVLNKNENALPLVHVNENVCALATGNTQSVHPINENTGCFLLEQGVKVYVMKVKSQKPVSSPNDIPTLLHSYHKPPSDNPCLSSSFSDNSLQEDLQQSVTLDSENIYSNTLVVDGMNLSIFNDLAKSKETQICDEQEKSNCDDTASVVSCIYNKISYMGDRYKPTNCTKCGKKILVKNLFKHMQNFHPSCLPTCKHCQKFFPSKRNLERHLICRCTHFRIGDFQKCPKCDFQSKNASHVFRHYWNIHEEQQFSCDLCGKTFKRTGCVLNEHLLNDHKVSLDVLEENYMRKGILKILSCSKCDFRTTSVKRLTNHDQFIHNPVFVKCKLCNKSFNGTKRLEHHVKIIHEKSKLFKCSLCDFTSCYITSVRAHQFSIHKLLAYKGQQIYKCSYCHYKDLRRGKVKYHERMNHGDDINTCDICGKVFARKLYLRRHLSVHSAERKFKCHICPYTARIKTLLKVHLANRHSDEKPYVCEGCGHGSKNKSNLNKHKRSCSLAKYDSYEHEDIVLQEGIVGLDYLPQTFTDYV